MPGGRELAILDEILARALQVAQEAEVFSLVSRETPVLFEANRLKSLETRETTGASLRIIKDGRVGFSSTSRLDNVQRLVDDALEIASFGAQARFQFPGPCHYPSVPVHDTAVEQVSLDGMVHLGQALIDRVLAHSAEVQCDARVGRVVTTVTCVNSRGGRFSYTKAVFGVGIEGTVVRGEDMLFVGDWEVSCHPITHTSALERSVVEQLENARVIASVPTRTLPVVFTPHGVTGLLLAPLLAGFNGKNVVQGTSPLVEKLGSRVADPRITLSDDPLLPYAPGSRMCDDEGTPSQRTVLMDRGVASNFLFDLQTAGQAGKASTGSASRGGGTLPAPDASVLVVSEGDASYRDMVAGMKEGLVVDHLLGAGQSNILSGDFNANVLLGYKVERGHIVGRAKNVMVSGNVYRVLSDLEAVGRDARWVGGSLKTPAIYCREVAVASKS